MNRLKLLRPASFRGIGFDVEQDSKESGRRVVTHKYPGRDHPFHEDMGAEVKRFSIDAWINGDDFIARADALETALNAPGSGTLIHPIYGELEVVVVRASRSHSTRAVGDADFSITFELYGGAQYPLALGDTAAALGLGSTSFMSSLAQDFTRTLKISGVPDFITGDADSRLLSLTGNIKNVMTTYGLQSFLPPVFPSLMTEASDMATSITDLFSTLGGLSKKRNSSMIATAAAPVIPAPALPLSMAMTKSASFSVTNDISGSSTRAVNARALENIFQGSSLAAAALSAQNAIYESREQAIAFRDLFATRMETVSQNLAMSGWEESWGKGNQMTAALVKDINERVGRLPRTVSISTTAIRPSLEIANRLYGDDPEKIFSAASDLVSRNAIKHPGFIPAKKLEVLINASS